MYTYTVTSHLYTWYDQYIHTGMCYVYICIHMYTFLNVYMYTFTVTQRISQMGKNHVPRMDESCHTYEWVMSHIWMQTGLYCACERLVLRHDSFNVGHDSFICVTWRIHMWDMTLTHLTESVSLYVLRVSTPRAVTWLMCLGFEV